MIVLVTAYKGLVSPAEKWKMLFIFANLQTGITTIFNLI